LLTERSNHLAKISELNNEVIFLNFQLNQIKKQAKIVTNDTTILDEVTEDHKKRKINGIKFDYKPLNLRQRNINVSYASEDHGMIKIEKHDKKGKLAGYVGTNVGYVNKTMLKHSQGHQNGKKTTRTWTCHYCKRKGHIRPFCYKLHCYPEYYAQKSHESGMRTAKKEWIPKGNNVGLMARLLKNLHLMKSGILTVDVSRHMTGKNYHIERICYFW